MTFRFNNNNNNDIPAFYGTKFVCLGVGLGLECLASSTTRAYKAHLSPRRPSVTCLEKKKMGQDTYVELRVGLYARSSF